MYKIAFLFFLPILLSACSTGGEIIPLNETQKILVAYHTVEKVPPGVKWFLVKTKKGLALIEKDPSSESKLRVDQAWKDKRGYHFVYWVEFMGTRGTAFEFVVPRDITKTAIGYRYADGTYSVVTVNGVARPVPLKEEVTPYLHLIPD